MKKIIILILFLFGFSSEIFAISEIEELLIKEATNPELKKIAKEYLIKKAKDHKDLAERYKSLSNLSKGGKAISSIEEHKKYKKLAEHCEKEASIYEQEANNL
ncbi:hypothetical protein LEP1GSC133_3803 [Leptospira borgpetersenii serovar Pomona str. 200901868]|uniref:Uncharacterized protein n=1 Tax=Leptospira borgpetersenii serovar Pomona str. 200901868 TaxID=1192866 RepID=M6W5B4_LEPBO|nr:hypothetical protein LEP1GSC133_3803 [Leptospira borgpetersenii serovar Pomona str. 200901868]